VKIMLGEPCVAAVNIVWLILFGREDPEFKREATDKAAALRAVAGL